MVVTLVGALKLVGLVELKKQKKTKQKENGKRNEKKNLEGEKKTHFSLMFGSFLP